MQPPKSKLRDAVREVIEEIVVEEEEVAAEGLRPGMIVDRGKPSARKVPWTEKAMRETYLEVTFTPEETVPVTVNGVRFQLISDRPATVPSVVRDIYDEHRKARRSQSKVIMTSSGPVNVLPGAGALEPEAFVEK